MYKLNPFLKDFWVTRAPYKLLKGGRFSSKSNDAAGMAAYLARHFSVRFLCVRQFQNRIADSVYTLVKDKIIQAGWESEFDIGVSTIVHKETKSEFLFYGLARNILEIKGLEGIDILWIEEGEGLTEDQWMILDPTIRKAGSECWIIWNPRYKDDFIESKLPALLGDSYIIKHINYTDNPFLSPDAIAKAERMKDIDPAMYEHIYLGIPLDNNHESIIKSAHVLNSYTDISINKSLPVVVGYDVADSGKDKNAIAVMQEIDGKYVLVYVDEWNADEDKLVESAHKAYSQMTTRNSKFIYDAIGVGAHVGSTLAHDNVFKFVASGSVHKPESMYADTQRKNKDMFENIKAQAWVQVADWFRTGKILISNDIPDNIRYKIREELTMPSQSFSKNGKYMVQSKKDLSYSPNIADAIIMSLSSNLITGGGYFG